MSNSRRVVRVLAILSMVLMLATGGALAAVSYDNETAATSTTSDITGGETVNNFNASQNQTKYIEIQSDSDNPELRIEDNATNDTYATFGTGHSSFNTTNSTAGHYKWNLTHEEMFSNVDIEADENVSVDVVAVQNASVDEENETTSTATITLAGTDERAVIYAGTSMTNNSDVFTYESFNEFLGSATLAFGDLGSTTETADIQQDNVAVNGSETTVTLALADDNASGPFSSAASDADAGDWIKSHQLYADGEPMQVYMDEAPDDVNTSSTYAVYDSTNDEITVELGDEHDGKSAVDIHAVGNESYGLWTQLKLMDFGILSMFGGISIGALGAGAFVFGRPKIQRGA